MRIFKSVDIVNYIPAIIELRECTGFGLVEAKSIIDHIRQDGVPAQINIDDNCKDTVIHKLRYFGFEVFVDFEIKLDEDLFKI